MEMLLAELNFVAILVAVVTNLVVGALWYSPLLFGKSWYKLIGKSKAELAKVSAICAHGSSLIAATVTAFVLLYFIFLLGAVTFIQGAQLGALMWLGFYAMGLLPDYVFSGRSFKLYCIQIGNKLFGIVLMAGILASWQ